MLDGLESVPWARLTCTCGTAEDIPSWLRILTSLSAKMRATALWHLSNDLVHQTTVWTATVAAVPFFIELLSSSDMGSKDNILDLLSDFADGGYSDYDATASRKDRDAAAGAFDTEYQEEGDSAESEDDRSEPQRAAIRAGVSVYLTLMNEPNPSVRAAATKLLGQCRSATFDPRPALEAAYARETDTGVRVGLLFALASTQLNRSEKVAFLSAAMRSVGTAEERVAAAMKLAEISRGIHEEAPLPGEETSVGEISNEVLGVLIGALTHPSRRVEKAYKLATRGGRLIARIDFALDKLPPERLRFAVPQLISCFTRIGRERVHRAVGLLLRALFAPTNGKALTLDALSDEQRQALDALFEVELFWRDGIAMYTQLDKYGLPESRPLLADYLGHPLPPRDELGAIAQPQPHRPAPFTLKAYEARIRDIYGYLHLKRKKGYRFERGADVDVYSPDNFNVFFFPKTVDDVLAMEREVALLGSLPRLPLMRWYPGESSRDTRAAGRFFIGGFRQSGTPLARDALEGLRETKRYQQFAVVLARFLSELHAVPLDTLRVSLPTVHTRSTWEQLYTHVQARVFDAVSREARQRIADRIEPFLGDDRNWTWTPTLIHGDFAPRNILYCAYADGDAALSEVAGFRHAGLGDPAYDLATLLGLDGYGEEYVRRFEGTYPRLNEELVRARFYAVALALRAALAALDTGDQETFNRTIATRLD